MLEESTDVVMSTTPVAYRISAPASNRAATVEAKRSPNFIIERPLGGTFRVPWHWQPFVMTQLGEDGCAATSLRKSEPRLPAGRMRRGQRTNAMGRIDRTCLHRCVHIREPRRACAWSRVSEQETMQ